MKSKLHTILFLLGLCCASVVSLTVTAQDFLEPDNQFMGKESNDEYANELKHHLFPEEWSIGYLSVPSFFGEYGLFLLYDSKGSMLVYNQFRSNYYYYRSSRNKNETQISISRDTMRISNEEAERLTGIITDAINKAVKPDGLGRLGFDGTNYYFMLPDKMARIWSPEKESECQKLVNEFENLRKQFPEEQRRMHEGLMYVRHNIARLGLGYSTSLGNSPITSGIGPLSNTYLSIDLMYRRFYIGSEISDGATLKAGFSFIERETFRTTAFLGSYNSFAGHNDETNGKLWRIEAGMFADFRLYSFRLGPINGIELSAGIFASRDKMKSIEPSYSLNASLSLLFTFDPDI